MELKDIYYIALQVISGVLLVLLAGFSERVCSSKWRLCYLAPALICMGAIALTGYEKFLLPAYLFAAVAAVGFFIEKKPVRIGTSSAMIAATVISAAMCIIMPQYRSVDYVKDFEKGIKEMENRYVLTEHKQINWDDLHDRYLPKFEEANELGDELLNCKAWKELCGEFYDGHVGYVPNDMDALKKTLAKYCGKDYGLCILNYTDGRAVAVNVDESLNALGIHNGTVIVSWNGEAPEEAAKKSDACKMISYPDKENEYFYRSMLAAGTGSGDAEVTFIDDNGNEQTVELPSIGKYYERLSKTLNMLEDGIKAGNMSFTQINDTTVCLRIKQMIYDSASAESDDYGSMKREIKYKLKEFTENGVTDVVIDLRNNAGGSGTLVKAIAEVFAPEGEHFYCCDGVWDSTRLCYEKDGDDRFKISKKNTFKGENILGEGRIIMLVSANTVSAGDHITKVLGSLDNVTVMGFTGSCSSAQGVSTIDMESGAVSVSCSLVLNEDGSVMIDTGADRVSPIRPDMIVPFDEEAVKAIYDNGEDYLMDKAVEELLK